MAKISEIMSKNRILVKVGFKIARSYAELASLYNEMSGWIKANGFESQGTSVEYYYTGPDVPEMEQVTRIEMPLE